MRFGFSVVDLPPLGRENMPPSTSLRTGVGAFQRRVGQLHQAAVFGRVGLGDEVLEVLLVPDLPGADRALRDQRVLGPEAAVGSVSRHRSLEEARPGAGGGAGGRQVIGRFDGVVGARNPDRGHRPGRGAVEEGQYLDAGIRRLGDDPVDAGPVEAAAPRRLHRAPVDRDAGAVDAAALQALELFLAGRRLRDHAPEGRRHRLRGRGEEGQAEHCHGQDRRPGTHSPTDLPPRFSHRASSPSAKPERRDPGAGAAA